MKQKQVPMLYWTATAWAGALALKVNDSELSADQPVVEALARRLLEQPLHRLEAERDRLPDEFGVVVRGEVGPALGHRVAELVDRRLADRAGRRAHHERSGKREAPGGAEPGHAGASQRFLRSAATRVVYHRARDTPETGLGEGQGAVQKLKREANFRGVKRGIGSGSSGAPPRFRSARVSSFSPVS